MTSKGWRRVMLLHPFELPTAVCLLIVAVIFTLFPASLEHAAVSFEQRGIIHHIGFHYTLLSGSSLMLLGLFAVGSRGLDIELSGIALVLFALIMNFVAQVSHDLSDEGQHINGLALATRLALIVALLIRAWIIRTRPTVVMTAARDA